MIWGHTQKSRLSAGRVHDLMNQSTVLTDCALDSIERRVTSLEHGVVGNADHVTEPVEAATVVAADTNTTDATETQ